MKIMLKNTCLLFLLLAASLATQAQKVDPKAYYTNADQQDMESTTIEDGQAPLSVRFQANPSEMGTWTPSFEWHFRLTSKSEGTKELFVRYEEDTQYTFMESGTYNIVLKTTLTAHNGDTAETDSVTLTVSIAESKLEFPNAFSPNGDGVNDVYRAKKDYKSIVKFRAIILNRWGQKLYEWNDPAGYWDGTYHGKDVAEGVYFVLVEAEGADGKEYKIRKDVNLLRGYTEKGQTTNP